MDVSDITGLCESLNNYFLSIKSIIHENQSPDKYANINNTRIYNESDNNYLQRDQMESDLDQSNSNDPDYVPLPLCAIATISFVEELNKLMSFALLVEYTITVVMLAGIMMVNLMPNKSLYIFIYSGEIFFLHLSQLLLMSWRANEIYEQSTEISDSLAESRWYEQSREVKQIIQIMMIRAQRRLTIAVGKFFPMSLSLSLAVSLANQASS